MSTSPDELDQIVDQFDAEWRSGGRPNLNDALSNAGSPTARSHLLRALMPIELEYRLQRGEQPDPSEYLRFAPDEDLKWMQQCFEALPVARRSTQRTLLLGLLALQNGFLSTEQFASAVTSWENDRSQRFEHILMEKMLIQPQHAELLCALANVRLRQHENEAQKPLHALDLLSAVKADLEKLGDSEIDAILRRILEGGAQSGSTTNEPSVTVMLPRSQAGHLPRASANSSRFRILRTHAAGGLGQVSVALDEELQREVAFKEIKAEYADHPESRERFVREAEITGTLEHPGIVPVYGLGTHADGRPYYAMRFIQGDSLMDWICQFHQ